jgi:methionyl-tRNA formyltransferase
MKIVILSPSQNAVIANRVLEKLLVKKSVEVVGIIHRKISFRRIINEEMKLGFHKFAIKVLNKFIKPKIESIFKKKLKYSNKINSTVNSCFVSDFNEPSSVEIISGLKPDLIVFTGGGIVRQELLEIPRLGILNCHMGILPKYRGSFPFVWAILQNDKKNIGCTVHFMDAGIDTGPIYKKYFLKNIPRSIFEIQSLFEQNMSSYLLDSISQISKGEVSFTDQETLDGIQYYIPHKLITSLAENKVKRL